MPLSQDQVVAALRTVKDPELHKDIVTLGMVKGIALEGDTIGVRLELSSPAPAMRDAIEKSVRQALERAGAANVHVEILGQPRTPAGPVPGQSAPAANNPLPQVKRVIAVGAGKGGVGKSTLAVNIAIGLARTGAKVGLMDGDIYGPSMPTMLGIRGQQPAVKGSKIVPFHVHGLHAITIGALVEQDKPLIWRGPMAHGAFKQLFADNTDWPALDYMIVDLPPGTGDVPLTLCQLLPLTGAVVVATPQQVALDDAIRAVKMFQQLGAPVLGLIENMSYMPMPDGSTVDLFGRGGARTAAQNLNLPFLGELPLYPALRVNSDSGNPTANFESDPPLRLALEGIVRNLVEQVAQRDAQGAGPQLNIL
ncbi:MAG TPA: Mrp/NBP35 family ATP-binding protein [Tepidisphaeraceae bacterium]|nr:Mrp/NBP35 family ATP-binding protein [Tepidisphaeraceae bacterium]